MGVIAESLCFCNGVSRSEKMKAAIFAGKSPAVARISDAGTGFLIHRNLLLTTHGNIPSATAAECTVARMDSKGGAPPAAAAAVAALSPQRFFVTSSVLDLSVVGIDALDGHSNAQNQQPQFLKPCAKPNLDLGSVVYVLGYTEKKELTIGEGKVVIATDSLIKLSTDGVLWSPGSAGFDAQGNLAFMICDPMKLVSSRKTKSSSSTATTSSSSCSMAKRDRMMQFGIPIPVVCDWLSQHWEGSSLDEVSKPIPKSPIIRLMSAAQKSEHSCAMRQVFKSPKWKTEGTSSSSFDPAVIVTSMPVRRKESPRTPLLDINFPHRITKPPVGPTLLSTLPHQKLAKERFGAREEERDAQSCSSAPDESELHIGGFSSEEGETMYSAETAESRNIPSPEGGRPEQVVCRSQSCLNYNTRWGGSTQRNSTMNRRVLLEQQRGFVHGRTSQRTNEYFSPTVSSIMKKRMGLEPQPVRLRPRQSPGIHSSPRWVF